MLDVQALDGPRGDLFSYARIAQRTGWQAIVDDRGYALIEVTSGVNVVSRATTCVLGFAERKLGWVFLDARPGCGLEGAIAAGHLRELNNLSAKKIFDRQKLQSRVVPPRGVVKTH